MIKYIHPTFYYFFLIIFFLSSFSAIAQTASIPHSLDEAISLFNAGNHKEAKILLKQNLEYDPDDSDSRSILGKMDYHLGEWQSAITIWSKGLNGKPSDYVFHMNIGNVFFEKAQQNQPSIYLKNYSENDIQTKSELYQEDFLKNTSPSFLEYWQNGIDAYLSAYKIYPYEEYILEQLAELHEMNREFNNSFIYHKQLAELYPDNSSYLTKAAIYQAKIKTSTKKEQDSLENLVLQRLNHSLEIDSQNPDTYKELARITAKKENFDKRESAVSLEMTRKADFYASIPSYARFEFSTESALLLDRLLTKNYSQKRNWSKLIDSLINSVYQKNSSTQNLLITVLAADASDSELPRSFDNYYSLLKERNSIISMLSESNYGQWLLIQLLAKTKEIKLTQEITTTLVDKKSPNMHDVLIDLLEYDYLPESMDIAKNLSKLNDERSRIALIKELYLPLPKTSAKWKDKTYYALQVRQMRAALALSSFKKDIAVHEELLKGLERPDVRLFCAVALYAQIGNSDYLKLAKKYKPKRVPFPELGQFLKQFNDSKANSLGDKLIKG